MGGYAGSLIKRFFSFEKSAAGVGVLAVACDPNPELFPSLLSELGSRKVPVCKSIQDVLKTDVDAVWLPVPINLHRPFSEMALAAGKPVMCEKPAAGCVKDVDAMIAARDARKLPLLIGFQDVYRPQLRQLKRRIVAGEFGRPVSGHVVGVAPRGSAYYSRNKWAGALKRDDVWVLDSPANNAISHLIHLTIFLLGKETLRSAQVTSVTAELYRANPIENFDTCSIRATVDNGNVPILIGMSHAVTPKGKEHWDVELRFEKATIRYLGQNSLEIESGGKVETISTKVYPHVEMLAAIRDAISGTNQDEIVGTLEMARMHTLMINGVSACTAVQTIGDQYIENIPTRDPNDIVRAVKNLGPNLRAATLAGKLFSETQDFPWANAGGSMDVTQMKTFPGPKM